MKTFITLALLATCLVSWAKPVTVQYQGTSPMVKYALSRFQKAVSLSKDQWKETAINPQFIISHDVSVLGERGVKGLQAEGFAIQKQGNTTWLLGADEKGAMYATLEAMEAYQLKMDLNDKQINAAHPFRAIKFNLPYMAYRSDKSIAQHDQVCRDLVFWERYLDMMVDNRYNVLSLWSLHLFHYMVIPTNFPEASHYTEWEMAEWKKFWTRLFEMADERGIDTYIINWNTFVSPGFARAHKVGEYNSRPWHYGMGDTSAITEQYTRQVITQVIDEYPGLDGLGITLGERMGGQSPEVRRAWLDRTIFAGMRDAKRKIKFVYRAPLSANTESGGSTSEENDLSTRQQIEGLETNGPVWLEFKYNWSHGHSSPNLFIVHGGKLTDKYRIPEPQAYKYIWTVRNEDFFVHRWGQPDFVRAFIQNNSLSYVGGCFIGSEVFIPAKDYVTRPGVHKTWDFAFERQWLWYAVWGRLLYDPSTSDVLFEKQLETRYGKGKGEKALEAWKNASQVPLLFASFHQGRNDLSLYTEGFCSWGENKDVRFFDINEFIDHAVLDTTRFCNIKDFVSSKGASVKPGMMSPLQLADSLDRIHKRTLSLATSLKKNALSPEVPAEIADLEAWAWYAAYFAHKIRAGVALAEYRIHGANTKQDAIKYLELGVKDWEQYARATTRYNLDEFMFHTKAPFSWMGMLAFVKKDIELAANN